LIAGNHDGLFENFKPDWKEYGITYLENEWTTLDNGITIAGSPMCPEYGGWFFMEPDEGLDYYWRKFIGLQPDILVTHTPPYRILDDADNERIGCMSLRLRLWDIMPKVHIFGHIHAAHGHMHLDGIDFYNVALLNEDYKHTNPVTTIEI